jgi:hypothetical protein
MNQSVCWWVEGTRQAVVFEIARTVSEQKKLPVNGK